MKKISLKDLILNQVDQLSREQLKNVLGGYAGSSTGGATTTNAHPCGTSDCTSDADCSGENPKCHSTTCISNNETVRFCGV